MGWPNRCRRSLARLAGVRRNPTCPTRSVGFEQVPAAFRRLIKDYTQTLLLVSGCSPAHCANEVSVRGAFLAFYLERHASATTLAELAAIAIAIDAWVAHLEGRPTPAGERAPTLISWIACSSCSAWCVRSNASTA
jgi:hypothetical protein